MLKKTVELFLEKHKLLNAKNNIIVAFSGGYDSMCLLDIMMKLKAEYHFNLIAIHLNHNWRGKESDNEEETCKSFCKNVTFYSERLSAEIPHTETAAREARYNFFEKCAKKFNSRIILTAHNANDNAETIYYRMQKGTGITGLEGIQENRRIYYRPLLSIYRNDIEKYCKENNLKPNNDSSNTDTKYARNKIRHEIFPQIKKHIPNIEECLNNLSQSAKEANRIINQHIKPLLTYSTDAFVELSEEYQNAIIHNFFREQNIDYDKKTILKIANFINSNYKSKAGKTISLTTDKWLFVNNKIIEIVNRNEKRDQEVAITETGEYNIGKYIFEIKPISQTPTNYPEDKDYTAYIEIEDIDFTLRNRKDGDIIQPLGVKGTQKLKKYFNEHKIPNHEKDNIILLSQKNEIFWVAGYGISDKIKVKSKPTHIIKLRRA